MSNLSTAAGPSARRLALRAVTALAASIALLLGGALTIAPAANAIYDSSISGTLTDASGVPVADEEIGLYQLLGRSNYEDIDSVDTDEAGKFSFTGLEDGTYTLSSGDFGGYRWQYAGGVYDMYAATKVVLGAGQAKTANMQLSFGQTITGTVTNAAGAPIEGVELETYQWVADGDPYWDDWGNSVVTDADGKYAFENRLAGAWTVRAYGEGNIVGSFYGGSRYSDGATPIALTSATGKSGVNFTLATGGTVSGVVKTPTGDNFGTGYVSAIRFYTDAWGVQQYDWDNEYAPSSSDGKYTITGLQAGTYTLAFYDWSGNIGQQLLGGVSGIGGATRFTVASGSTRTINVKLVADPFVGPSTTKVTLSKSSRAYGTASTATVAVTGKGAAVAGTVKLTVGSKTIGTKNVVGGKATFALPANLAIGKHSVHASYTTSGNLQSSKSAASVLTVTKIASKVTAKANKKASKLAITVSAAGSVPTGTYVVKAGKTTVATGKLTSGKASAKLTSLGAGKHKLKVTYQGSSKISSSSTRVTVKR